LCAFNLGLGHFSGLVYLSPQVIANFPVLYARTHVSGFSPQMCVFLPGQSHFFTFSYILEHFLYWQERFPKRKAVLHMCERLRA
jgi:hypothetical protein